MNRRAFFRLALGAPLVAKLAPLLPPPDPFEVMYREAFKWQMSLRRPEVIFTMNIETYRRLEELTRCEVKVS